MTRTALSMALLLCSFGCTREEVQVFPCEAGTALNDDLTECSRCQTGLTRIETDGGFLCSDAGPCQGMCTGEQVCRVGDNVCVDCLVDADCTDPDNAKCGTDGTCGPCDANAQCAGIGDRGICDSGGCVECNASNDSACGGNPCNAFTGLCSEFGANSAGLCEKCDADANCSDADTNCVETFFGGSSQGGHCLQENTGSCPAPLAVGITRTSLSGAVAATYCGINETLTTCDAVLLRGQVCTACSTTDGARCETLSATSQMRCTYGCDSSDECPASGNLSGCGLGANNYCGS